MISRPLISHLLAHKPSSPSTQCVIYASVTTISGRKLQSWICTLTTIDYYDNSDKDMPGIKEIHTKRQFSLFSLYKLRLHDNTSAQPKQQASNLRPISYRTKALIFVYSSNLNRFLLKGVQIIISNTKNQYMCARSKSSLQHLPRRLYVWMQYSIKQALFGDRFFVIP